MVNGGFFDQCNLLFLGLNHLKFSEMVVSVFAVEALVLREELH